MLTGIIFILMTISLKQTLLNSKLDMKRRCALDGRAFNLISCVIMLLNRGVMSVLIYRAKRYFYLKKSVNLIIFAKLLRYIEFHYCHNEIDPQAIIGHGLVLSDYGGIAISKVNVIGTNCTFIGKATLTLGGMDNVHEDERIVLGNHCVIGPNVRIASSINIANGVQVKSNSVVMEDINTDGSIISGFPAKIVSNVSLASVINWNPILCYQFNNS